VVMLVEVVVVLFEVPLVVFVVLVGIVVGSGGSGCCYQ